MWSKVVRSLFGMHPTASVSPEPVNVSRDARVREVNDELGMYYRRLAHMSPSDLIARQFLQNHIKDLEREREALLNSVA